MHDHNQYKDALEWHVDGNEGKDLKNKLLFFVSNFLCWLHIKII